MDPRQAFEELRALLHPEEGESPEALEVWKALTCDSDKLAKMGPSGIQRIVHGLYCMASTAWTTMDHLPTAFLD